ncbi:MAG: hypothetical protein J1F06_01755 [Prevotellaceae bacterium]|nr:hypothetical protein [Prevotellaceae bacterium]
MQQLTGSDEEEGFSALMRSLAGGDFLAGKWFRRQISFIFLLVVLTLAYTTCRYACQKELSVRQQLTDTLIDRQYKALTISSEFKERTRGSKIEEQLTDSTLHSPVKPLFTLSVSRKQDESKTKDRSEH